MTHRSAHRRTSQVHMSSGRLLLALVALVLVTTATASAASIYGDPTGVTPNAGAHPAVPHAPTEAGTFTAALSADVQTLDPAITADANSLLVTSQIYDTLVAFEPGGTLPVPALAESWTVSTDHLTWTFNLRPGVKFHDGSALDAAALVFNLQRWWDPENAYHVGDFDAFKTAFYGFKGNENCLLAGVGVAGPLEFQITTTLVDAALPSRLAAEGLAIASPAAIQAGTLDASPSGTGPYRFVERVAGDHVWLHASADYWGAAPLLDDLTFRVIPDAGQRYTALASGEVQSADGFSDTQILIATSNPALRVLWRTLPSLGYLGINRAHGPLGNPLVRQAIAHAVNVPKLVAGHYGASHQVAGQFLPSVIWAYDPNLPGYDYDPALARSLLAQAGYSAGIDTSLSYRDPVRIYLPDPVGTANAIAADLSAVGIRTSVTWYESSEFLDKAAKGDLDLILLGWYSLLQHPANFFEYHFCNPTNLAFGPLDAELCDQLAIAGNTFDISAQLPIYTWATDRVYDTLPALALTNPRSALITRFDVAGLVPSLMSAENYEAVRYARAEGAVTPASGGTISYADAGGQVVTATVPAGGVAAPLTLRLAEAPAPPAPSGLGYAGQAFEITALEEGVPQPGFTFDKPMVLAVDYAASDVSRLMESSLALYLKIGDAWINAADTCSPPLPYLVDPIARRVSVSVCHLTEFALFGDRKPAVYLPIVIRSPG